MVFVTALVRVLAAVAVSLAGASVMSAQVAPGASAIIRGRVTADSTRPILGATVVVTVMPSAPPYTSANLVSRAVDTDSAGRYEVAVPNGSGNYLVHFSAPGYQPSRQRITRRDTSNDSVLVLNARLVAGSTQSLAAVKVTAPRRRRPQLTEPNVTDIGNVTEQVMDPISDTDNGDLAAIAATVPGVTIVQSSDAHVPAFSVLGLSPADNVVHLGGLVFNAAQLPTTSRVAMALKTTAYDVAVGGFSGGALELSVFPGSNYSSRGIDVSGSAPLLQATDLGGRSLGTEYRDLRTSVSLTGPIIRDQLLYNIGFAASDRSNPAVALGTADANALEQADLSPQAATQTRTALQSLGLSAAPSRTRRTTQDANILARFDIAPRDNRVLDVIASGSVRREDPTLTSPTDDASQAARATSRTMGLQGELARYINTYYLTRLRSGLFLTADDATPLLASPAGVVRITSALPDGEAGLASVGFGGGSQFPQSTRSLSWQTTYEAMWFAPGNAHRPKITGGLQLDTYTSRTAANLRGTFVFNSLADLESSTPAAFSRTLAGGDWKSNEASGWISAGDLWQVTSQFSTQYGIRVEGNHYGSRPAYNGLVDTRFHLRTDALPTDIHLSPRIGFTWGYGRKPRVGLYPEPLGTLRGGIGAFQGTLPVTLPGAAIIGTGLPGALTQITCIGPAAPQPDWAAYGSNSANIPSSCADTAAMGSPLANFADALPRVTTVSPTYAPTRAWRGSLGWTGDIGNAARLSWDAIYSLNLNRPSMVDLNLAATPSFVLADENNRPVFAAPSAIDLSTGGIAPLATRKDVTFSSVSMLTSDVRSESRQLSFTIQPTSGVLVTHYWTLGYAYTRVRDQARGFDGAAFDDPRRAEWGTGALDIRHSFTGSFTWTFHNFTQLLLDAQVRSGAPYTPVVLGDVNGDGLANDRAFIFDPAHAPDSTTAAGMRQLLHTAPPGARACLLEQLGTAAARNSCRGPWTAQTSARLRFSGAFTGLSKANFTITATNLLGGLDALMHGSNHMQGWGQPAVPNPTLLEVRGFNPATRTFSYQVNPTFGDTRPMRSLVRAPFALTLTASLPLGAPPYYGQVADQLVRPGRREPGTRLTADEIAKRYSQMGFLDPVRLIFAVQDSLVLSAEQSRELATLHARYTAASDSVWHALGVYLASLPADYSDDAVLHHVRDARLHALDLLGDATRELRTVLTPDQLAVLSPEMQQLIDERLVEYRKRAEQRAY